MRRGLALAALALAGCVQPLVTSASRDEVIIKYDPAFKDPPDLQDQADAECGRYGKRAQFRTETTDIPGGIGFYYARFDCL